jgi:uncharacterized membrane protein YqhA
MFQAILSVRFIMLLASLGAILGALLMLCLGGMKLIKAASSLAALGEIDAKVITAAVMGATDAFLFAVVLMIFAYAVAFGFVLEAPRDIADRLPAWIRVDGVRELKHTLVEAIIVYLVVDFATDLAEADTHLAWQALVMPISILLIAASSRMISGPHHARQGARREPDSG